jgi:hypothetical protein
MRDAAEHVQVVHRWLRPAPRLVWCDAIHSTRRQAI